MIKKIILGTRKSKLALAQTHEIIKILKKHYPKLKIQIKTITTLGDQKKKINFKKNIGIFTKEIEKALLQKKIDIAVHSLKDLPTKMPKGLTLTAVLPRVLPQDVLVSHKYTLKNLPKEALLGTGSPRRKTQLKAYRKDLKFKDIRGNLPTRLDKIQKEKLDGIIVAAAGLIRLEYLKKTTDYRLQTTDSLRFTIHDSRFTISILPYSVCLPAAGQGAIGLETRVSDFELIKLLKKINHSPTWCCITAERSFMKHISAGCNVPAGALAKTTRNSLKLEGFLFDKSKIIKNRVSGLVGEAEKLGKLLAAKIVSRI